MPQNKQASSKLNHKINIKKKEKESQYFQSTYYEWHQTGHTAPLVK